MIIAPDEVKAATVVVPVTSKSTRASVTAAPEPAPSNKTAFTAPFFIVTFAPEPCYIAIS